MLLNMILKEIMVAYIKNFLFCMSKEKLSFGIALNLMNHLNFELF